jgi:FixJ family two-component response regulator
MDKVLILDGDTDYLKALKSGLDKMHQFKVKIADNEKKAMELLTENKVSVFVSEIAPPGTDALHLLAHMTQRHPTTPCIVMTDPGKPVAKKSGDKQSFLCFLEKPFELGALVSAIVVALNLRDEGMNFQGMSMASILPMIETLKKTCYLEVTLPEKGSGYLYFKEGVLRDSYFEALKGKTAALEVLKWKSIKLKLIDLKQWQKQTQNNSKPKDIDNAAIKKNNEKIIFSSELTGNPRIASVFEKKLKEFKGISGYRALAVMGENEEILASHQTDPDIPLIKIASEMKQLLLVAEDSSVFTEYGHGKSLVFHIEKCTAFIVAENQAASSGLYMIGFTKPYGNVTYMKTLLRKLLNEMKKS